MFELKSFRMNSCVRKQVFKPVSADVLETLHLSYDGARHPANNKAMMCGWFLNNPDDGFNLINTLSV